MAQQLDDDRSLALRGDGSATMGRGPSRPVLGFALVGLIWTVLAGVTLVRWLGSDDVGPAPILGPDAMPTGHLIGLRVVEVLSTSVLIGAVWVLAVRPYRRDRRVTIDALLLLGGVVCFVMDCWLNLYDYLFAFNAHSVNLGSWSASLPFHREGVPSHYAESLLWGLPMYVYFCAALGYVGTLAARALRRRFPTMPVQGILAILWVGDLVFDFVVENTIIRTTEAYAFVRTNAALTLWDGHAHQFPIYESVLVACVSMAFTWARWSCDDDPHGLSVIERGVLDLPAAWRLPARALAAIGFCAIVLMLGYHLPFNWLGVGGTSVAELPSYLLPSP